MHLQATPDFFKNTPLRRIGGLWYNSRRRNEEESQMPITLTAGPAVIDGARSYAERNGMTLEAFVLAYLESAARRENTLGGMRTIDEGMWKWAK